jgi:hypothetical protein
MIGAVVDKILKIQQTYKPFTIIMKNGHKLLCQEIIGFELGNPATQIMVRFNGFEDIIDVDLIEDIVPL